MTKWLAISNVFFDVFEREEEFDSQLLHYNELFASLLIDYIQHFSEN